MPSLRTKSISTKVTDEEYALFEALAGEQTISEWARDVLLKATKPNAGDQTVLAEVLALRTILLNLHFAVSQGQTLTGEGIKVGDLKLEWQRARYNNAKLHEFLGHWIYQDQTLTDLAKPALWGGLGVLLVGLVVATPKDSARKRIRRHGRRLKGPELVTAISFNRRNRSDGIGFLQQQSFTQKILRRKAWLRLPREIESSHILVMGDSGKGKSALIRQILLQIEERGETAIVYDPATPADYVPYFLTPSR